MQENKIPHENHANPPKPVNTSQIRPPLQSMLYKNLPEPVLPSNPQNLNYYFLEIFNFLEISESNFLVSPNYLSSHTEITQKNRAFLIDFLITVHFKFRLMQETLHICVNIIDRYLSKRNINKKQLQLVGITALFIASKYEEIYPPKAKDFVKMTEEAYSKQNLLTMEVDMLKAIDFQITFPTASRFLEKNQELLNVDTSLLCEFLLEIGLVEYSWIKFKPSIQAASAIFVANFLINKKSVWQIESPSESEIQESNAELLKILKFNSAHPLTAVREKYLKKKLDLASLESFLI